MGQAIIGTALVLGVAFFSWLAGFIMASLAGRRNFKEWLDKNGCYLCQEKHKGPLDLE